MHIRIGFEITVSCPEPVPMLLALSIHSDFAGGMTGSDHVRNTVSNDMKKYVDRFGNRITRAIAPQGLSTFWSDCIVEVERIADRVEPYAVQSDISDLPNETLSFLLASRYCDSDLMADIAWNRFGSTTPGWQRVQAICDFVHEQTTFGYNFGRSDKTASHVLKEKTGVCRDFAHLAISLCRAMNIPARYVSGYLGDVDVPYSGPGDFCAWMEVYLGGQWHTFDARYNTPRIGRVLMVKGHDASDVAMITSFGKYELVDFRVWTDELRIQDRTALTNLLSSRPAIN